MIVTLNGFVLVIEMGNIFKCTTSKSIDRRKGYHHALFHQFVVFLDNCILVSEKRHFDDGNRKLVASIAIKRGGSRIQRQLSGPCKNHHLVSSKNEVDNVCDGKFSTSTCHYIVDSDVFRLNSVKDHNGNQVFDVDMPIVDNEGQSISTSPICNNMLISSSDNELPDELDETPIELIIPGGDCQPLRPLPTPIRNNLVSPERELESLCDSKGKPRDDSKTRKYFTMKRRESQASLSAL
jgi:hypothetical protein